MDDNSSKKLLWWKKAFKTFLLGLLGLAWISTIYVRRHIFAVFESYEAGRIRLRPFYESCLFNYVYIVWLLIAIVIIRAFYKAVAGKTRAFIIFLSVCTFLILGGFWFLEGFGIEVSQDKEIVVYDDGTVLVKSEDWRGDTCGYSYKEIEDKFYSRPLEDNENAYAIRKHGDPDINGRIIENKNPIVEVATIDNSGTTNYSAIYANGKLEQTESFTADKVKIYDATNDFENKIVGNRIVVTLKSTYLIDEDGNESHAGDDLKQFMQSLADVSHNPLWNVQIIEDGDRYLAFVKLNVNWWTPCILYEYDADNNKAVKLYEWDDVDLQGIKLADIGN